MVLIIDTITVFLFGIILFRTLLQEILLLLMCFNNHGILKLLNHQSHSMELFTLLSVSTMGHRTNILISLLKLLQRIRITIIIILLLKAALLELIFSKADCVLNLLH